MDYSVFKFGVLYLDTKAQPVPRRPMLVGGDVPPYDGSTISVGPLKNGEKITWIKPNGLNILIADRVLLANVSWEDLNQNGFIAGRPVLIDRQYFRCRLLQVGEKVNVPNEWDATLDETGENNALWHWNTMYFWGADVPANGTPTRVVRGRCSARHFDYISAAGQYSNLGFRPILDIPSCSRHKRMSLRIFQVEAKSGCTRSWRTSVLFIWTNRSKTQVN